jgi:hypothetical protein
VTEGSERRWNVRGAAKALARMCRVEESGI